MSHLISWLNVNLNLQEIKRIFNVLWLLSKCAWATDRRTDRNWKRQTEIETGRPTEREKDSQTWSFITGRCKNCLAYSAHLINRHYRHLQNCVELGDNIRMYKFLNFKNDFLGLFMALQWREVNRTQFSLTFNTNMSSTKIHP